MKSVIIASLLSGMMTITGILKFEKEDGQYRFCVYETYKGLYILQLPVSKVCPATVEIEDEH
jgi:hypothetical protein